MKKKRRRTILSDSDRGGADAAARSWRHLFAPAEERIIFIGSEVTDDLANLVAGAAAALQSEDATKDVGVYINSPGGSVTAGLAIYDTMQFLKCDVVTYCVGQAARWARCRWRQAAQAPCRFRRAHHDPPAVGGAQGAASDIHIQSQEILRLEATGLNGILARHTGKPVKTVAKDTDRDFFMSAEEAVKYGLVDDVLGAAPSKV